MIDDSMKGLLEEFVAESKEHLSTIEEDFLELERQKDDPDKDLVNKIFRAIHTIKGTSGFFGLENITNLSHAMENILSTIRSGDMVPTSETIDLLLTGADLISTMIDDLDNSNEVDIEDIVASLKAVLDSGTNEKFNEEIETEIRLKNKDGKETDFVVDLFTLNNISDKNKYLYLLKLEISDMSKYSEDSPVKLIQKLLKNGSIIDSKITLIDEDLRNGLPNGPIFYDIVYMTNFQPQTMEKRFKFVEEEIEILDNSFLGSSNAAEPSEAKETIQEEKPEEVKEEEPEEEKKVNKPVVKKQTKPTVSKPKVDTKTTIEHSNFVRIHVDLLDKLMRLASELVLVRNQELLLTDMGDPVARNNMQRLDIVTTELQETIMLTRMQPVGNVFNKFQRIVRELGKKLGKNIDIHISGNEVELDKTILENLTDPLTHLIRNSCDHGVESPEVREAVGKNPTGNIWLRAYHEGGQINIEIRDDGKGIDPEVISQKAIEKGLKTPEEIEAMSEKEIISLIMMPGFSTAEKLSDVSGRGVGMDVVKEGIEKLNGSIDLESTVGQGSRILLRLPLTLAIIPCLVVSVEGNRYAIPQVNLEELVTLYDDDVRNKIECAGDKEVFRLRNQLLTMVRLNEVLNRPKPFTEDTRAEITEKYRKEQLDLEEKSKGNTLQTLNFAVLKVGSLRFGLIVDEVLGTEEIVVKPMHSTMKSLKTYSGATVMGDGKVALIIDVEGVARHTGIMFEGSEKDLEERIEKLSEEENRQTILLFKNGFTEQFAVALPLIRRIEKIKAEDIEQIGMQEFITVDGVSTRILRLDQVLNVSPTVDKEELFLLLPKHTKRPFGILASSLTDIEEIAFELNTESYMEDGLLGTAIIRDNMTLFIDIYRLIEIAAPEWFENSQRHIEKMGAGKRVLQLEDSSFFRELVKGYLLSDGYEVVTVPNGKKGLEVLNEPDQHFDLIVSDIEMPQMNGWEFIKEVRTMEKWKDIPAIALTSLSSEEDKQKSLEAGFNAYEVKIEREKFLVAISNLFEEIAI